MKTRLFIHTIIIIVMASTTMAEPNWIPFGSSEYALTETGGTWTECEAEANSHGTHLVALNDSTENAFLVEQFGPTPYWIGLHEIDNNEIYVWSNGDPVDFTAWAPGQPDRLGWDHDYVSINLVGDIGQWHNSGDAGWPSGTPSSGIMERPVSTAVPGGKPASLLALQNYPNPFNPCTTLSIRSDRAGHALLCVFDASGRRVDTLLDGMWEGGTRSLTWQPRGLPSGVYLARFTMAGEHATRRLVLVR